ncbi:hypothetical protein FNV43_RR15886 [Rhamnella rubrinervis]|uniref:SET domain-containing protein n=1 Tax=Rhamnella rubrinervis TaxID=2594499 RepID=A0A8K0GYE5_9ROSA|nr:hypothetical protein FNV43_RR15886 [Rhamnella rubrinervis]
MPKFELVACRRWVWRQKKLALASSFFSTATQHKNENMGRPALPGPPPIRVGLTESAGRVCYFCLRKLGITTSCQSQAASFCSEECQKQSKVFHDVEIRADWSAYDDYCRSHGLKYPLLVKRFACMVISGGASPDLLDILQPASLSPEVISLMEEDFDLLRSAFTVADIPNEQVAFLTKQWYIGILARIRVNAFRVEVAGGLYEDLLSSAAASIEAEAALGNAVYMLPSFYNHDCDPNAHIIWIENVDARLKALRDVDAGEELRICYIDASMDRDARQTLLSQGFGFQCSCSRCLSGD